jgi:SAM-dependent methyltransferase
MYGAELAAVYELIYRSRGKDWAAEAVDTATLIRAGCPDARSLLDVACGTGAHLATFQTLFDHVEGLELATPMREVAAKRLPGVRLHAADMRRFDLGRTFDAVVCMFTAIGYLPTVPDMRAAIACMARHLRPGGILVVEPWWFPDRFVDNYVAGDLGREGEVTVARISHSTRRGRHTRMDVRFLVGNPAGVTAFDEIDVLTLFTLEEYLAAFSDAGCPARHLPISWTARGVFVGHRQVG